MHPVVVLFAVLTVSAKLACGGRDAERQKAGEAIDSLEESVKSSLKDKKKYEPMLDLLNSAKANLVDVKTAEDFEAIINATEALKTGLPSLSNTDKHAVAMGAIHIMQAGVIFAGPPIGPVISCIFGTVAGIVGRGGRFTMGQVVKYFVNQAIERGRYKDLLNDINGAVSELEAVDSYIQGNLNLVPDLDEWTDGDFDHVNIKFDAKDGVHMLGKLESELRFRLNDPEQWRESINLMKGYSNIVTLRNALCYQIIAILMKAKHLNAAPGGWLEVIANDKKNAAEAFEFVLDPTPVQAKTLININPTKVPELYRFMKQLDRDPYKYQNTEVVSKCLNIRSVKWPTYVWSIQHTVVDEITRGRFRWTLKRDPHQAVHVRKRVDSKSRYKFLPSDEDGWMWLKNEGVGERIGIGRSRTLKSALRSGVSNREYQKFRVIKTTKGVLIISKYDVYPITLAEYMPFVDNEFGKNGASNWKIEPCAV